MDEPPILKAKSEWRPEINMELILTVELNTIPQCIMSSYFSNLLTIQSTEDNLPNVAPANYLNL